MLVANPITLLLAAEVPASGIMFLVFILPGSVFLLRQEIYLTATAAVMEEGPWTE